MGRHGPARRPEDRRSHRRTPCHLALRNGRGAFERLRALRHRRQVRPHLRRDGPGSGPARTGRPRRAPLHGRRRSGRERGDRGAPRPRGRPVVRIDAGAFPPEPGPRSAPQSASGLDSGRGDRRRARGDSSARPGDGGGARGAALGSKGGHRILALSFVPGGRLSYQYRLEWGGERMECAVARARRPFCEPRPGPLPFRSARRDLRGSGSAEPAVVSFRVFPPFWRRGWFLAIVGLALAGGIGFVHRGKSAAPRRARAPEDPHCHGPARRRRLGVRQHRRPRRRVGRGCSSTKSRRSLSR